VSSKADVWKAYYKESWTNPPSSVIEATMKYYSDEFQGFDKDGNVVMSKDAQVGMAQLIMPAFKDFRGYYSDIREEGDSVFVTYHFEGTHTGDLDLSAMGLGVIPASGKKIIWPEGTTEFKIKDGKFVSSKPYGDSGGTEAFLEPLGVKLPTA
jgi:hypothetical protein